MRRGTPEVRRQIFTAVSFVEGPFRRVDGTWVSFEDNTYVITNEKGELPGI